MIGRTSGRAIAKAAYRLCFYSPHWRIGWRFVTADDVWDRHDLGGTPWQVLPNAAFRFFADPFPVKWQGRTHLFFEDFDHRRGKAVISTVAFGPSGPDGDIVPVLEEPWHLSYPFMIEDDGELWMIPESIASRSVSIYRANPFPYRWTKEADLLCGVDASDATVFRHDGRFWMFTTIADRTGSLSSSLHIFIAERLLGPWREHPRNPVLTDLASARPAGNIIIRDGRLWRPVQDCRQAYGAALGLAEIVRLDMHGYQQEVRTLLRPNSYWPGRRLHTLNRAGALECIDGSALAFRHLDRWRERLSWARVGG